MPVYLARDVADPEIVSVAPDQVQAYLDAGHGWRQASDQEITDWARRDVYGGLQGPPAAAPLPPTPIVVPPTPPHPTRYDATPAEGQHRDSNRLLAETEAAAAGQDTPVRAAIDPVGRQVSGVLSATAAPSQASVDDTGQESAPPPATKGTAKGATGG